MSCFMASFVSADQVIDKTIKTSELKKLLIDNMRGTVIVHGWDKKEVHITGELGDNAAGLVVKNKGQMMGGVKARLATMRSKIRLDDEFNIVKSNF